MGAGEAYFFTRAVVFDDEVALKAPRADADEGHAVSVAFIHVGLEFEDVSAEGGLDGVDGDFGAVGAQCCAGVGTGGEVDKGVEEGFDAEVCKGGGEEDGGHVAGEEFFFGEGVAGCL